MIAVVKSAPLDGPDGTEVRDCPVPKPGPGEALIRVAATAICGTDKHIYHWDPSIHGKVQPPRVYGHEFCGFVEALGPGAERAAEVVRDLWRTFEEFNVTPGLALEAMFVRARRAFASVPAAV